MKCRYSMDIEVRIGCLSMKCRYSMAVEVRMGFSARCRACGNSRLCRNVAELSSLPFLRNEGVCPKYTPSARIHCILERTLVSLTPKHLSVNSTHVRVFQKTVCSTNMTFRTSWGISFHEYLVPFLYKSNIPSMREISKSGHGITGAYGKPAHLNGRRIR